MKADGKARSTYTIPLRSLRIWQLVSFVFAIISFGIAFLIHARGTGLWVWFATGVFAIVGLNTLARVFTLPSEYRKRQ